MSLSQSPPAPPRSAGRSLLCTPQHQLPSPRTTVIPLPILQYGLEPWVAREVWLKTPLDGDGGRTPEDLKVVWRSHGPCIPTPLHSFIHSPTEEWNWDSPNI